MKTYLQVRCTGHECAAGSLYKSVYEAVVSQHHYVLQLHRFDIELRHVMQSLELHMTTSWSYSSHLISCSPFGVFQSVWFCVCVRMYSYMQLYTYTWNRTHTHIYIYIFTYAHTCVCYKHDRSFTFSNSCTRSCDVSPQIHEHVSAVLAWRWGASFNIMCRPC